MNKTKNIYWVTILILLLLWTGFIFCNSMRSAGDSTAQSSIVLKIANQLLASVHLGPVSEHIVRKLAHFTEFAMEGALLMLSLQAYFQNWKKQLAVPLLVGILVALTDETIQLFSEGRSAQVTDVWIDTGGVAAGVIITVIVLHKIHQRS